MDMQLAHKCAFVTAGFSNLGNAICTSLAREGVNIAFTYTSARKKEEANSFCVHLSETYGVSILPLQVDITKDDSVKNGVQKMISFFHKLDIVVNNAGVFNVKKQQLLDESDWDHIMNVNIKGIWRVLRYTQPIFKNKVA
jgi:NADP-dependent 3-hydroxy acid dehydrogenase YdfG